MIVVDMLLVFSYSKLIKLLGSNKSNYGGEYRDMDFKEFKSDVPG